MPLVQVTDYGSKWPDSRAASPFRRMEHSSAHALTHMFTDTIMYHPLYSEAQNLVILAARGIMVFASAIVNVKKPRCLALLGVTRATLSPAHELLPERFLTTAKCFRQS
jgi:hypothetical protein